jgi:hypothetical protein
MCWISCRCASGFWLYIWKRSLWPVNGRGHWHFVIHALLDSVSGFKITAIVSILYQQFLLAARPS